MVSYEGYQEIPVDPEMVNLGDCGELAKLLEKGDRELNRAYEKIIEIIEGA